MHKVILSSKLLRTFKQCAFVALRSRQREDWWFPPVSSNRHTICIFVLRVPPRLVHLRIQISWCSEEHFRCTSRERIPAWPKIQLGKLESGRDAAFSHFPISSLSVSLKYYFSFFLLDSGIKVVARPQRPRRRSRMSFCHFPRGRSYFFSAGILETFIRA